MKIIEWPNALSLHKLKKRCSSYLSADKEKGKGKKGNLGKPEHEKGLNGYYADVTPHDNKEQFPFRQTREKILTGEPIDFVLVRLF